MLKKIFLNKYQGKITKLKPLVMIKFSEEIPLPSAKEIVPLAEIVNVVNSFEQELKQKPDNFFKVKTEEFKMMIASKTDNLTEPQYKISLEAVLDEILPFYYAMVRETACRTLNMRHFDVQILGGIILHKNKIAEMTTGEGKTLIATLAASLNALAGEGVHIVTVNDYLANRDYEWMSPVYAFLGLSCGVIQQDMGKTERKAAYDCDITYGTNNEFGFDYLRDNMSNNLEEVVQRQHFYAIVDEVDSILIDEARTPLIISGPAEVSIEKYYSAENVARQFKTKLVISRHDTKEGIVILKHTDGTEQRMEPEELEKLWDAIVEEKSHNAYLTKRGEEKAESLLQIKSISEDTPDRFSNSWVHYLSQALRSHYLFKRDKDYIVKDAKVIIVDDFTGRLMPGRRWSDGLHQAVEAKEKLRIQQESQTLATITLQNYFRMYKKLAGMTGTAYTEANEFKHIYHLDTMVIPTNEPLRRLSNPDRIYKNKKVKFNAVISEIGELYEIKKPILVGTASIEDSEELSYMLERKGIPHNVLNAKYHEREAHIIAQAGRLGQITIATNMAGRGTDIVLGGNIDFFVKDILNRNNISFDNPDYKEWYDKIYKENKDEFEQEHNKVVELGGLHVIGTQRHEARRIDNQLRGRAGRQGDPGSSRFYISLQDDLMRLFGSEKIYFLMEKFGFPEDEPIEHGLINRSIEVAQRKVEAHNFEIRKHLLEYDDVLNKQREVIYRQRRLVLEEDDIKEEIIGMIDGVIEKQLNLYYQDSDWESFTSWIRVKFSLSLDVIDLEGKKNPEILDLVKNEIFAIYEMKEKELTPEILRYMEKNIALWVIDSHWKNHLLIIDSLKEGIHLRGHAQVNPLVEYQKEAYALFNETVASIKEGIVEFLFKTKLTPKKEIVTVFDNIPKDFVHSQYSSLKNTERETTPAAQTLSQKPQQKVGRNDPCPCGSGKKYKKCCGK